MKNIVIQNHSIEKAKSPIETGQATAHAVNGGWPSAGKSSFKPSSISSFHETSSVAFDSRETIDYPNEPSIWSKNDSRGPVSKQKLKNFKKFFFQKKIKKIFRAQFLPQFKGHTKMIFGHQTISPNLIEYRPTHLLRMIPGMYRQLLQILFVNNNSSLFNRVQIQHSAK